MASSSVAGVPGVSPMMTGRLMAVLQIASELLSECTDSRVVEADKLLHRINENLHGEMIKEDAAAALLKVKAAQVEKGHPEFWSRKKMQNACQDVLVVCCCRDCNQSDLPTLKWLFNDAFQNNMPTNMMADLLNSRHQLFQRFNADYVPPKVPRTRSKRHKPMKVNITLLECSYEPQTCYPSNTPRKVEAEMS